MKMRKMYGNKIYIEGKKFIKEEWFLGKVEN